MPWCSMRREPTLEEQRAFIRDAIMACRQVSIFVEGRVREDLSSDILLQSAVIRQIEVLGEACSRAGSALRAMPPRLPWRGIVDMRNRLIHGYFAVDLDVVWWTAVKEIPALLPLLEEAARGGESKDEVPDPGTTS